jgi:hypothetical protein
METASTHQRAPTMASMVACTVTFPRLRKLCPEPSDLHPYGHIGKHFIDRSAPANEGICLWNLGTTFPSGEIRRVPCAATTSGLFESRAPRPWSDEFGVRYPVVLGCSTSGHRSAGDHRERLPGIPATFTHVFPRPCLNWGMRPHDSGTRIRRRAISVARWALVSWGRAEPKGESTNEPSLLAACPTARYGPRRIQQLIEGVRVRGDAYRFIDWAVARGTDLIREV